ncbi:MAG TPA: hypothetical protein VGB37_00590 [Candidatus Lokiarchaeia archaeon]
MNNNFELDYDPIAKLYALNDTEQQVVIVLNKEQLEVLIDFYCKQEERIII